MTVKLGFTGTRKGMTIAQVATVRDILEHFYVPDTDSEFHHGNCVGSDEEALMLANAIGYWTVAHPAKGLDKYQISVFLSDEARNYRVPLSRNRNIVDETEYLIAAPLEAVEPKPARGQGTWSTVRYARPRPLVIVWPDGTVEEENIETTSNN